MRFLNSFYIPQVLKPQKAIVEEEEKVKLAVDALELDDIRVSWRYSKHYGKESVKFSISFSI